MTDCGWCGEPIPPWKRKDATTCSQPCRQKLHRFGVAPVGSKAVKPLRLTYADPPYPGMAQLYGRPEVDHDELIAMLVRTSPDGWALSTSSKTLLEVAQLVVKHVGASAPRICSWHKGWRPGPSMFARDAWEPLIVVGGRPLNLLGSDDVANTIEQHTNTRQRSMSTALIGMKTGRWCEWMFKQLGALRGDTFIDLFPGSGSVDLAWRRYTREAA